MEIIRLTYPFTNQIQSERQVMAIGYFDGVHLGHQEVIRKAIYAAKSEHMISSIMTFDPHPREVLGQNLQAAQYITPLEEKLERFADCGLDRTYILTFDRTLSLLTPEQFIHEILFALHVDTVVVGFNFTYGHLGRGTVDMLREIGGDQLKVNVIRPFHMDNLKVSSTVIRENLHAGKMKKVTQLLGRPYSITGQVVHGLGRGRTIGIPTANIEPRGNYVIPRTGVYAVKVNVSGVVHDGVINVGFKPTFDDNPDKPTLEVHILEFNQSIYGESIQIDWIDYIRTEQKFSSVDQLVNQIQADILQAKKLLSFTS
ncbi:MAG: bifunctional riboflavin kinase/FAD synthetase [Paenibacillaceae bacterium]